MKREPLKKKYINSSEAICIILSKRYLFQGLGVIKYSLVFNGDTKLELNDITIKEVFSKYKNEIDIADTVEVIIDSLTNYETFQYNEDDTNFYLVEEKEKLV